MGIATMNILGEDALQIEMRSRAVLLELEQLDPRPDVICLNEVAKKFLAELKSHGAQWLQNEYVMTISEEDFDEYMPRKGNCSCVAKWCNAILCRKQTTQLLNVRHPYLHCDVEAIPAPVASIQF